MHHLFRKVAKVSVVLAVLGGLPSGAQAETRSAIVIGNSDYPSAALANPANDARLMARTLKELGFDVTLYLDVTAAQTPALIDKVRENLSVADVGLLYFAGHGLQYKGENLLLPVDTDLDSVAGIAKSGTSVSALLQSITEGAKGIKILVLDACRNNLVGGGGADLKAGFSFVEAPEGEVLIAFSTGAGEVALDSSGGTNSPYTTALANSLQQSGADIYDVFRSVRRAVRSGTGGQQIPWITGSIETDYVFRPAPVVPVVTAPPAGSLGVVETAKGEVLSIDLVLWEYLQTSTDPADFARFAEIFPRSPFAAEAEARRTLTVASNDAAPQSRDGLNLSAQDIVADIDANFPDAPAEGQGRRSLLIDQSGSYVMRDSFRTWPLDLPTAELGLTSFATSCDEEAADPVDPLKLSPGVSESYIDIRRALRACAFDLAADPENPRLIFQFARALDAARNYQWANAFYDKAIALGYGAAMVSRGTNAREGRGHKPDVKLAFELYRRAALMGNLRARSNLARAYQLGEGVAPNPEEAVLWVRLGASMGWPHAVNYLGDLYLAGEGVEKDPAEAFQLYQMAAGQGQTTAMANVGLAYLNGTGAPRDVAAGLIWLERSMSLGNGFAPVYAGRFHMKGDADLPADPEKAKGLFEAATRRGNAIGYLELARGYVDGAFAGGADAETAYRNALFAQAGRVKQATDLIARIEPVLAADRRSAIAAEVAEFIEQNGL